LPHLYVLAGPLPNDPTYLSITTDDDGLISEMIPPSYRAADAVIKRLVLDWRAYAEGAGSPSGDQTITLFNEWVLGTYGDTYSVRNVW